MAGIEFIRDLAVVLLVAGVVGWICQRLGLSLVVGYLVAGAIIGPYTPPFQLVADSERVQMLSQVGLVFLIFSIGLDLGLPRLRRLGFTVVSATAIGAILVFNGARIFGIAMGWNQTESLFVAGMIMVSSSAILSKVFQELNVTHERSSQMALGVTVLEDVVAVVMLTLLSTLIQFGGQEGPPLAKTVGALGAFMAFLLVVSILFVPRLLLRLTQTGTAEVRTIIVIGILLTLAWLAARAGYSLALGAFLIGVIVGSTPQKAEIERVFQGVRDMFGAVFFVAMGMLVDFSLLGEAWLLIIALTLFTIFWRTISTSTGLILSGTPTRQSLRAGLALTPLGEFSFIIAQLGVSAGAIPPKFYPMAVGASLLTTLAAPAVIRRSNSLSKTIDLKLPLFLREWIAFYHAWLQRVAHAQRKNLWWKLTRPRLIQTGAQLLLVSAIILFARPIYNFVAARVGTDWASSNLLDLSFWTVLGLLVLAPLVAIWRNMEALVMIFSESVTRQSSRRASLQPVLQTILKGFFTAVLAIWFIALLPFGTSLLWGAAVVIGVLLVFSTVFWRRLVYFHSRVEIELRTQLQTAMGVEAGTTSIAALLQEQQEHWNLQAEEFVLPEFAAAAGKKIAELALRKRFGSSIVSIDRGGVLITNPSADTILYPNDKLLLLGSAEQIARALREMSAVRSSDSLHDIEEFSMETVRVPHDSPHGGKTLITLDPIGQFQVQVAGIRRNGAHILTPSGDDKIEVDDELLVLGTPQRISEFKAWLLPPEPANAPEVP